MKDWLVEETKTSRESLETSMPTNVELSSFMEVTLSRKCELACGVDLVRLWRLFGLVPRERRRSCSVSVFADLVTIDLPSLGVVATASLRFAVATTPLPKEPSPS